MGDPGNTDPGVAVVVKQGENTPGKRKEKERDKQEGGKKRRVKRGKKIRKKLEKCKLLYVNLRGLKSKKLSLEEIIIEEDPTIIALVETGLEEGEKTEFEGYEIYPKNKTTDGEGRGLLIAVKEQLKNITTIVREYEKPAEQMWIRISNGRNNIRLGVVYAPQESRTKLNELKEMYQQLNEQIEEGKSNQQQIMIIGDFNCKVGEEIKNNKKAVTKGGRLLLKTVKKFDLQILNATESCKGLWTREEKGKKSVLDYVLIKKEDVGAVEKMYIDEGKHITPYTKTSTEEKTYTDHNTITVKINWTVANKTQTTKKTTLTQKNKERFKRETTEAGLCKIWEGKETQEAYTTWNKKVGEIADGIFKSKRRKKQINKTIRKLRKRKQMLKKISRQLEEKEDQNIMNERRKLITEFINEIKEKQAETKVIEVAEKIRKDGGFDANAFWKHSEIMRGRKKELATAMKDENGRIKEDPEEIKEIYRNYFEKLLQDREPEGEDEKELEKLKEKCIKVMEKAASQIDIKSISDEEYNDMKKQLKKKKAPDKEGWRYEWIEWAGEDLERSIKIMLNQVLKEKTPPDEWKGMTIKAITKNKNKNMDMVDKRGLFLTNIISKCMEKIILNRRLEALQEDMQPFQNGGIKGRSTCDNLFIVNNVIEDYRKRKENLYILFGDLEKCFDKLYLKDCIIELEGAGVPVEEAIFIYNMNKNIQAEVNTPVGITKTFEIKEAVRQGTVLGPPLCGISTNRLNKMGKSVPIVVERVQIKYPIYVDDIVGMGGKKDIELLGEKMKGLETIKKFQFNNNKNKTEILAIRNNKKEETEEIEIEIRKGKIGRTKTYKYLGDNYDESGDNNIKIDRKMEKAKFIAYEVKRMGSVKEVGKAAAKVRLMLLESIVKPTLLANTETWCRVGKAEEEKWRKGQYNVLKIVMEQRDGTPYWGIIAETGAWPYKYIVKYKKMMFIQNLLHSSDTRIAKNILLSQSKSKEKNYYNEAKEEANEMGIELDVEMLKTKTKSQWKRIVKEKVKERILSEINNESTNTKMRFIQKKQLQPEEYINKLSMREVSIIMKLKLNMVETKGNFPNKYADRRCITDHV